MRRWGGDEEGRGRRGGRGVFVFVFEARSPLWSGVSESAAHVRHDEFRSIATTAAIHDYRPHHCTIIIAVNFHLGNRAFAGV